MYSLIIINKAGGLVFQRDFNTALNKLTTNDYLVLAGTFHGCVDPPLMHCCASLRISKCPCHYEILDSLGHGDSAIATFGAGNPRELLLPSHMLPDRNGDKVPSLHGTTATERRRHHPEDL